MTRWCDRSTNGTFVNDTLVTAPHMLQNGDIIQIGNTDLHFELRSEDQGSKTSSMPEEISLIQPKPGTVLGTIELNGKRFEIKNETVTLGRDPSAAILIDDPTVSYMHAEIAFHNNRHYLRDLGSRNGTFVNETLVVTPSLMKDNDAIRLGNVRMKFNTNAAVTSALPVVTPPKHAKTTFVISGNF